MAVTKVVKSVRGPRTAASLVGYLTRGGTPREGIARYEAVTATNGLPTVPVANSWDATAKALTATARRFPASRATHEVHHVLISFGTDELDPTDPDAVYKALAVAHAFAYEAWPTRQAFAVCQRDGEGGKLHVHFAVANLDLVTGKAARGDEMSWTRLAPILDAVMLDHDMHQRASMPEAGVIPEFKRRGHTKHEHQRVLTGADPRLHVIDVIEAARAQATTLEEYVSHLEGAGVTATLNAPNARQKYGSATYAITTPDGESVTYAGSKLGRGAGWRAVTSALETNRANPTPVRAPEPAAPVVAAQNLQTARLDGDEEYDAVMLRLRRRSPKRQPEQLTPARAAYLRSKGVITRQQQREYGG